MAYAIMLAAICWTLAVWIQSADGPALTGVVRTAFTAIFGLSGALILLDSWSISREVGEGSSDED